MYTLSESRRRTFRSQGTLLARLFVGGLFFVSGVMTLASGGVDGMAGAIEHLGVPFAVAFAWLFVFVKVTGGAGIILGWQFDLSALALIAFTALTVIFVHNSLEDPSMFKNLAVIGALIYMIAYGPGDGWSLKR